MEVYYANSESARKGGDLRGMGKSESESGTGTHPDKAASLLGACRMFGGKGGTWLFYCIPCDAII